MNKVIFIGALIIANFLMTTAFAYSNSNDPVLIKINEREVTVSEFEYVYTKNNLNPQVMDPKSMEEYLELFVNFNLKVYEAIELGLDTQPSFMDELAGYREQLARPYLTDQDVTQQLLDEAFERMQYDVRASHILISLDEHASSEDTLAAWNKAKELRNRVLQGEDFAELAVEYSDDSSAEGMPATANRPAMRGNKGDLGYFSVLDMVYPFETATYNLDIGEVSMPVRTRYGYHLIKLTDRLPAMGNARVAHIMVNIPQDASDEEKQQAREKINEIAERVEQGESFDELAKRFSDDNASGQRGGELPPFTSNRMVPEFIEAIHNLSKEDVSQPVKSQYGWHLIKLFEKEMPEREEAVADLQNRISRDSRAQLSQKVVIERIKEENNFIEHPENLDVFFDNVDNTIFEGNWEPSVVEGNQEVLFTIADKTFTQQDFAAYLDKSQTMRTPEAITNYVKTMYHSFRDNALIEHEKKRLPEKYSEFRQIMREYHDGILLFELTDQKVWSRAMQDSTGLKEFFESNIEDYMWGDRFDAAIYTFDSQRDARSGRRDIRRAERRGTPHEELMSNFNQDSQLEVSAEKGVFEVDQKPVLQKISKEDGITSIIEHDNNFVVIYVNEFLPASPKKLNQIRGLVIADYQNYLEEKWVEELREKYEFYVNKQALEKLKK